MNKIILGIATMTLPMASFAQSAIDAQQVTQSDFSGTARFMSMGGAFTALGGDLTTLNQNPAGIGVYRSNEVGVTLDINAQSSKTPFTSYEFLNSATQTKVNCTNFGFVGSTKMDGALKTLNWGVTYNRASSFDRVYRGYVPTIDTSLSNYIADFTYGTVENDLWTDNWNTYDPYLDSNCDWLSILAYNSYMINGIGNAPTGGNVYSGLFKNNSAGDALFNVRESGGVDEYNMSVGGNIENLVYWGLSVGITDMKYRRWVYYSESIGNAEVVCDDGYLGNGNYEYGMDNLKNITGSGWNIKAGLIIRLTNEFRIGLAVHTPTWYSLTESYDATVDYTYTPTDPAGTTVNNSQYSDEAYFEWKLSAPWKFMVGLAGVIGNKAIISADYEFQGYNSMKEKTLYAYNDYGFGKEFVENEEVNGQIKSYFKNASILRLGAEYRVTPQFSLRCGYNINLGNTKEEAYDGKMEVIGAGTDASYTFNKTTQNLCFGLGYRYQAWYIDAAYVYTDRESKFNAFTNWSNNVAPAMTVKDHNSSVVISTGFKF